MGWVTQRGPRQGQFLDLKRSHFNIIAILFFQALVALKLLVSLIHCLVACISADTHTDRETKYSNPRCACAPRVKNTGVALSLLLTVLLHAQNAVKHRDIHTHKSRVRFQHTVETQSY